MNTAEITETVIGCVTGLSLIGALIAREAVKRGWVRFSVSLGVVPLDKRGEAAAAPAETVPIGKGRAA